MNIYRLSQAPWIALCWAVLAASPAAAQDHPDTLPVVDRGNPAVATVLDMPHETPADTIAAVLVLLDLGETPAAAESFKPLTELELSPEEAFQIVRRHGTARLLALAGQAGQEPLPGARQFVERCLEAASQHAANPQRLARLIADLSDADQQTRVAARHDLAATGMPAVQACFDALAQATELATRRELMRTLADMTPLDEPLVIAALADGEGHFLRDVVELAGHSHLHSATPWLATLAAGVSSDPETTAAAQAALVKRGLLVTSELEASTLVRNELERLAAGIATDPNAAEDAVWWSYSPDTRKMSSRPLPLATRRALTAARLGKNLLALTTGDPLDWQTGFLAALQAAHLLGTEPSSQALEKAQQLPTSDLCDALDTAIKQGQFGAALTCVRLLGERSSVDALDSRRGRPSALVRAVQSPDRSLRFAAVQAIMQIHPRESFAGASYVPEALAAFAAGAGDVQAVVGAPTSAHANDWAGMLRAQGYDATPATTGIELLKTAVAAPRLQLVLVDSDLGKPLMREVVFQLRSHPQLTHVPLAVLCANDDLPAGRQLAQLDNHLLAVSRPHSDQAMQAIVGRLTALASDVPDAAQRTEQAAQAIEWLSQLLAEGGPYHELHRHVQVLSQTVYQPELARVSLAGLAVAGTADSQHTLAEFASQTTQPIELRRVAAKSFADSIQSAGCLLTGEQIAGQYVRYNASETADAETQEVLGQLLDALEGKTPPTAQP